MDYEIVDLADFSGSGGTIYSVIPEGHSQTLFETFIEENIKDHPEEVRILIANLRVIGGELGMRERYFKPNEGGLGDQICAMYVHSGAGLRLYFIRYGSDVIILGGGGYKAIGVRAWQDDPKLKEEAELLIRLSKDIGGRLITKEDLWWSPDRRHIEGDLKKYGSQEEEP